MITAAALALAVVAAAAVAVLARRAVRLGGRLERTESRAADLARRLGRCEDDRDRLAAALAAHGDGVVVVDAAGEVVTEHRSDGSMDSAATAVVDDAVSRLQAAALGGQVIEEELTLHGPPPRVLRLRAAPLWREGRADGAVVFASDVTAARRVESVRRDFVANVSHELKTPVGALALLAETMASEADPAVVAGLARRVRHEAERLGRLVDDLLDLSRVEVGAAQGATTREVVDVARLLAEAHDLVRASAGAAGIPVEVLPAPADLDLECDRGQVVSAIRNLLENAVRYSEPGRPVRLSADGDDREVEIVVEDHGVGIPRADLERIFERFYRVDRARSRETGGTGLGLAIVRHVAWAHGGDVSVESVEGEGSVFRLRLPRRVARPVPGDRGER